MAEITDVRSGQKCRVYTLDELIRFVSARLQANLLPSVDP